MHIAFVRVLLLSALALVQLQDTSQPAPKPAPQNSTAPSAPAAPQAAAPSAGSTVGMATCYLYRPRIYRGSAVRIGIFIDDTLAANLVNGRWVALQVPAGHHIIKPKDNQNGAEADFEAGKEYYFKTSWGEPGMFHGAHKLFVPVMKEEATFELKQLKPLDKEDIPWPGGQAVAPPQP